MTWGSSFTNLCWCNNRGNKSIRQKIKLIFYKATWIRSHSRMETYNDFLNLSRQKFCLHFLGRPLKRVIAIHLPLFCVIRNLYSYGTFINLLNISLRLREFMRMEVCYILTWFWWNFTVLKLIHQITHRLQPRPKQNSNSYS